MGCHHAREWIAVEVPYLLAEHLVKNGSNNPVKEWISKMRSGFCPWSILTDMNIQSEHLSALAKEPAP